MKYKAVELKDYIKQNNRPVQLSNMDAKAGFTFEDDKLLVIRKKIEAAGTPLGKEYNVYIGIKTGYDDVFLIKEEEVNHIISINNTFEKFIHKHIRGENIRNSKIDYTNEYIIYIPKGTTNSVGIDKFKELYGELIEYLKKKSDNMSRLENRSGKGDYWWEVHLNMKQDEINIKFPDMISSEGCFALDKEKYLCNTKVGIIEGDNIDKVAEIISSNITFNIFKKLYSSGSLGSAVFVKLGNIRRLPIPLEYIINTSLEDINIQEAYGLTDEEVEYLCK